MRVAALLSPTHPLPYVYVDYLSHVHPTCPPCQSCALTWPLCEQVSLIDTQRRPRALCCAPPTPRLPRACARLCAVTLAWHMPSACALSACARHVTTCHAVIVEVGRRDTSTSTAHVPARRRTCGEVRSQTGTGLLWAAFPKSVAVQARGRRCVSTTDEHNPNRHSAGWDQPGLPHMQRS